MLGIDLNRPIRYKHSSMRYFKSGEHHIERFNTDDILILVYEGVLRFSEDGTEQEVSAGEYYIQKHNMYQKGEDVSDSPKYLYVHFSAEWSESSSALPFRGSFDTARLKPLTDELDRFSHEAFTYTEQAAKFYEILSLLYRKSHTETAADRIAEYINKNLSSEITLDMLCKEFHFSKNHIVNIFKAKFKKTPIEYINRLRIQKAKRLLESTSESIESISVESGFNNYSHFYRLFLRETGISPNEWRTKNRLKPR